MAMEKNLELGFFVCNPVTLGIFNDVPATAPPPLLLISYHCYQSSVSCDH